MHTNPVVIPRRLHETLLCQLSQYKIVFVRAGAGWGKTTSCCNCLPPQHVYVKVLPNHTPRFSSKESLVVLDDFHHLSPHLNSRLAGIFQRSPKRQHMLILSRGGLPDFLLPYQNSGQLHQCSDQDLSLHPEDVAELATQYGLTLSYQTLRQLRQITYGYPPLVHSWLSNHSSYRPYSSTMHPLTQDLYGYYDRKLLHGVDVLTQQVLLSLSLTSKKSTTLAVSVVEHLQPEDLSRIYQTTGLLQPSINDDWVFDNLPHLEAYLQSKARQFFSQSQRYSIHLAAGACFVQQQNYLEALAHFHAADCTSCIVSTLLQAVDCHTPPWRLLQLSQYLHLLPESTLMSIPPLTYAMSRLASLHFDLKQAQRWYHVLYTQAQISHCPAALSYLSHLERCLPQPTILPSGNTPYDAPYPPTIPSTCGLPSVLRNEQNLFLFCHKANLSASYHLSYSQEHTIVQESSRLTPLMHAEYRFHRGDDLSALLLHWHSLQHQIQNQGTPSDELVFTALLLGALCVEGQLTQANTCLLGLRQRILTSGDPYLLSNVDAMQCRLALLADHTYAERWLDSQSPVTSSPSLLDGYQLLTRVRCHIQREEYHYALLILSPLLDCYRRCHRLLDLVETLILAAIICYRMGSDTWKKHLDEALHLGEPYHCIALFAGEGAALIPLLEHYQPADISSEYWKKLLRATLVQSRYYPWYLKPIRCLEQPLTPTEHTILMLLLRNKRNDEIGQALGIKTCTVRTHLQHLFEKMNVHSRDEAREMALRLNLDP